MSKKNAHWYSDNICGFVEKTRRTYRLQDEDLCVESDKFKLVKGTECREYYSCRDGKLTFYECQSREFFDDRINECNDCLEDFNCKG